MIGCSNSSNRIRPLTLGTYWVYEVIDSMNGEQISSLTDTVRIDTVVTWGEKKWYGQKSRNNWFQRNDKDGLFTLVYDAAHPTGYSYLGWKYPAKAGDKWTTKDTINVELVSTTETVTTQAGVYPNSYLYEIRLNTPEYGLITEWKTWRKPGVGTVMVSTVSRWNGQVGSKTEKLVSFKIND